MMWRYPDIAQALLSVHFALCKQHFAVGTRAIDCFGFRILDVGSASWEDKMIPAIEQSPTTVLTRTHGACTDRADGIGCLHRP